MRRRFRSVIALLFCMAALSTNAAVSGKTDFNGDGKADVLLQNLYTGALSAWLSNGTQPLQRVSYGKVPPRDGWVPIGTRDADGDRRSDIFFYNFKTGGLSAWLLNGANVRQSVGYGQYSRSTGWAPLGLNDFNGDGRSDVLWYNSASGAVQVWLLNANGSGVAQSAQYGEASPLEGCMPLGVRDVNADSRADLFWYNRNTGSVVAWLLAGNVVRSVRQYGALVPEQGWLPAGLADFNHDNRADLIWYNAFTGAVGAWLLNEAGILQTASYGTFSASAGWAPAGAEDVNGDGTSDLLWYNGQSGQIYVWLIRGTTIVAAGTLGSMNPSLGWGPIGLDDFNGDGQVDLLWQNRFSNATSTWLLNGARILRTQDLGSVPPSSVWKIQISR